MSPEQIHNQILDGRADVYSFGAAELSRRCRSASRRHWTCSTSTSPKPIGPKIYNADVTDEFNDSCCDAAKNKKTAARLPRVLMAMRTICLQAGAAEDGK
jgi:hypothetical protein